eukprot:TRINITY_DN9716_c0_g1_i1.p1 TRINITY_DN9716_c0_g1~~TRINITY_DN9716_c0_g1_i1.p1  ORF type:complete len:628 (+),score=133.23 TRINITY_DN9716_c0_g1_i1:92-1975(+)
MGVATPSSKSTMRGRSPGRSPGMRQGERQLSQTHEPPKDLWELRRMCPNVKWGGNVPSKKIEESDDGCDRGYEDPQLPAAYIQATRGYTPPTGKRGSRLRTSSLPSTPRAGRRTSLASASKSPWKAGPSRWEGPNTASGMSGVFSAPRSEKSGTYARPTPTTKRSKSPTTSNATSRIYTTSPGRPVFKSGGSKSLIPGIGSFLTSACAPQKREKKSLKTPKGDRSLYSKCPRRRSPSPRPGQQKEKPPVPDTEKLLQALHERTTFDRELREMYEDIGQDGEVMEGNSVVGALTNGNSPVPHTELSAVLSNAGTSTVYENADEFVGWQPLHWAAGQGTVEMLQELLSKGADVHSRLPPPDGRSPLDIACESLERSSIMEEDITEKREMVRLLQEASLNNTAEEAPKELLGAGIFSNMLDVLPRKAWDSIVALLPDDEMPKVAVCCKGLEALAKPRLLEEQSKRNSKRTVASTDNLGVAMNLLNDLDIEELSDVARGGKPTGGVLRVLQMLCIILGDQWLELEDVWPVAKYLLKTEAPLAKLFEKAAEPARVSWEEARSLLSILDEHANSMAVACDELLGSVLTLMICLLSRLISLNGQLPTLRLPEGFLMPSERPSDALYTVTCLKTI